MDAVIQELWRTMSVLRLAGQLAQWLTWAELVGAVVISAGAGWFVRGLYAARRSTAAAKRLAPLYKVDQQRWDQILRPNYGAALRFGEFGNEVAAHRAACLAVLSRALLSARFALRAESVSYEDRTREVIELIDAVHNLPEAVRCNEHWNKERVSRVLAEYDRSRAHRPNSEHLWPTRCEKLEVLYRAAFDGGVANNRILRPSSELRAT